jgi:hypothetical protein
MNEIFQGDNGTTLNLTISDGEKIVNLINSTVEVVIKYKRTGIKKEATITDATNGKCQITLNAEDVNYEGVYTLQATVTYLNGNTFTSNVQRFTVNKKIGYVPVIGGTTGDVGDSSINGNIILNGQEIKVYDDSQIKSDINILSNSSHVHTNKGYLDRLGINTQNHLTIDGVEQVNSGGTGGSSVSDSTTNGNILVNGSEVNVYNDSSLRSLIAGKQPTGDYATRTELTNGLSLKADTTQLHSHTNKTVLDQIEQPYTTAEKTKLANVEVGAQVNKVTSVNGQIGDVVIANSGTGILVFNTLADLQTAYPSGINQPVWIISDNAWYYWDAVISQPTNTAPSITSSYVTTSVNDSTSISIPYTVTDSEGGSLTATLTKDGVATTTTISTGSNTWNVGTLSAGSHTLTIQVKDSGNLTSNTLTFNFTVSVTNTAPTITSSYSTTSAFSNDVISIPYTITDAQGGTLTATYTKDGVTSTASVSTGANTWSVGTLAVGSHTLTIKVTDNGGLNSNTLTFNITVTASADTTAPTDVSGLSVGTATINSIPITWVLSPSGDVANYEVAYSSNGGSSWTVASSLVNNSSTSYTITGLVAGTNYTIRVVAIDTSSNRSTGVTITKSTAASVNYVLSATPSTGSYNTTQNVVLSTNPAGATIYYTTNGTTPTTASSIYSTAIPVSANTTIKFFAQDSVGNVTSVQTATYTIDNTAPVLTITSATTFTTSQTVTMSATDANTVTIWYTDDNTDPISSGTRKQYTAPITLSATTTIKAYAVDSVGNASAVQTVTYTKQVVSQTLVSDDFTRTSTTSLGNADTGQGWSALGGTWGTDGSSAYVVANAADSENIAVIDSTKSDCNVEVTFPVINKGGTGSRIVFRATDATNHWMVQAEASSYHLWYKSGGYNDRGTFGTTPANNDTLKVVLSGNSITIFVNGVQQKTLTDAFNNTATKHGIGIYGGAGGTYTFDKFKVIS